MNRMSSTLSVLDQSPISQGAVGGDALRNSIDLAQLVESLGYERYWIAEHHGTPMLASAAPEILITAVAAATSRIKVGSGGVMLPHYSPLKVAEVFSMLAALPGGPERPEVWLLGSSAQSAIWAGQLGLPYVFADFINPAGAEIAELYRQRFVPSRRREKPFVGVAVSVVCAESDDEAQHLASSSRMAMTLLRQGHLIPVPPVETALAFFEEQPPPTGRRAVVGSAKTVRAGIEDVVASYGADEAMIVTITYDHQARRRSYELVAGAFR